MFGPSVADMSHVPINMRTLRQNLKGTPVAVPFAFHRTERGLAQQTKRNLNAQKMGLAMGSTTSSGVMRISYYNSKGALFEEDINVLDYCVGDGLVEVVALNLNPLK